ncbi:O-antigen ligase family protein [Hymenobacter profundi]|uniref:O-antigen ligase family protein n=1 Tax=Hymenobacter profundi TaxID=1982110 RepID=A0ABS6X300_9BACT|nr:O-antigen ligase family protein [Hymenobacter profundi]MBW3130192.1 O-antigen ligase family protein [Hymenobacter profundi]
MIRLLQWLRPADELQRIFLLFVLLLIGGGALIPLADSPLTLLPAVVVLGVAVLAIEWRLIYYLFLLVLAFSREISIGGGFSMDMPSEPLMLLLLGSVAVTLILQPDALPRREVLHPLVILLGLGYIWAGATTLFSVDTLKSVKFLLAKTWYIGPFLFGTLLLLRNRAMVWRISGLYVTGVCVTVVYSLVRHATRGFTFDSINWSVEPFYFNHVTYATVLALLLPYTIYGARAARQRIGRWAWSGAAALLFMGLLVTYTRASLLSVPIAGLYYFVLRYRLTRLVLLGTVVGALSAVLYFVHENNYMLYAPDFEKTVFNGKNFSKHLEATYKLEDMSGMERVYRWVAAARMIDDKPLTGSGPSTFYPEYKRYTVWSFHTYVSDNPERSTTHNYFLLLLAEQGIPGFVLFALVLAAALLLCERLYHQSARPENRHIVLAASLSLVIIIFHLFLNELIEVDKIGSFFFIALAILIRMQTWLSGEIVNGETVSGE